MCWAVNCMKNKLVFSEVKKILVIRLDAAGDLILSTPFFRNLRDNFPNAVITALIREYTQGVLVNNPNVDKLLVYPEKSNVLKRINFILSLKKENFDFAVSLSPIAKSFFLSFLVAGKRTFSYSYSGRFTANIIASLLGKCPKLDIAGLLSSGERVPHEVLQTFVILKSLGINPKEYPLEAFPEAASFKFAESILPKLPAIGVHLSFKWLTGGWTEKDLAELVKALKSGFPHASIVVTYGKLENSLAVSLKKLLKNEDVIFAGDYSFSDWAAVISKCSVLVTTDTGALHCAAAMQTPPVCLYEASTFEHCSSQWAPWKIKSKILKKTDFKIAVEEILKSVGELIDI